MNHTSTRLRRTGAGAAIGALVASALMFAPAQAADDAITSVRESEIAKDATNYAGWHQGAVNAGVPGEYKVVNEGLELTGRSQVIKGYADNKNENLSDATQNFDITKLPGNAFTVKSGTASLQLPIFVDADGAGSGEAVFTTLRTPLIAGGEVKATDNWESSKAFGAIQANTPTPLSEIIAAVDAGTYKVIGFGVYNETGTSVISEIKFDGTRYLFANTAPAVKDRALSTKINKPISVPLAATDIDGNTLTYDITSVTDGTLTGSGTDRTFTPKSGFTGNSVVKYTVTDGRGGSSTATITIKVSKLSSKVSIYRVHPTSSKITTKSKVYVYAAVSVDGKSAPRGSSVYLYAKGKKVATGKVNSYGKVKMALPNKLPKGKSTLKVTKVGSKSTNGSSASVAVRVKK